MSTTKTNAKTTANRNGKATAASKSNAKKPSSGDRRLKNDPRYADIRHRETELLAELITDVVRDKMMIESDDPETKAAAAMLLTHLLRVFISDHEHYTLANFAVSIAAQARTGETIGDYYYDAVMFDQAYDLADFMAPSHTDNSKTTANSSRV